MASVAALLLALFFSISASGNAQPKVPAIYVFGDSTADVGNNNYLPGNNAKANFPHYGIDFPHSRPTGRFSNGFNGIDFLAGHMGFRRSPPPYLSLTNKTSHGILKGLRGVNFASAGSGILDSTGTTISMTKQIKYFATIRSRIAARLNTERTNDVLSKSIFLISSGSNDLSAFFRQNNAPNNTQKEQFYNTLIYNYKNHIEALYDLGARKFGIIDVAPIGCCPSSRVLHPLGDCIAVLNDLAVGANDAVKVMLSNLHATLKGMKYSLGSSHAVVSNIIADPGAAGYKEVQSACCGGGKLNAVSGCMPNATYCDNRKEYLFWDDGHPTQGASKKVGLAIYHGSLQYASPINFKQLVEDDG
ncbi:GDSL esterase/lipase At5g55050-like [Phoenix dactylifera]|uniref:GDSL esterase/lipase At5g55050-like n=1 Tax=Phoenix dactylifera TaxID=42345 RepID=A0A8B7BM58_PHODC|nr:GDSL esterase/lipase At5g55050-like [Phoenix dactylifera]